MNFAMRNRRHESTLLHDRLTICRQHGDVDPHGPVAVEARTRRTSSRHIDL